MKEAIFKDLVVRLCFVFSLVDQSANGGIFPSVSFITMFKQRENSGYLEISSVRWLTGRNCRDLAKKAFSWFIK